MFKKLKDKIAEEISPQRIQQFTQSVTDKLQNNSNDENLFSIAEDDSDMPATHNDSQGFQSISLHASATNERHRRNSNSSIASDISFLPRYESNTNMYHLQSDLDVSASEMEDNASTSSGLGNVSKEQVYSAFQKAQMRYHKYRGRYTDLANHYKELERENGKMKAVLVETQDKAIRRVSELREQCSLSQRAKADLEQALRTEIEEKLIIIGTLKDKVDFLQNNTDNVSEKSISNSTSISSFSDATNSGQIEQVNKNLSEARAEIETLNLKIQEFKANAIIIQSKDVEMRAKLAQNEKNVAEKLREFEENERETNIKFAKSKLELHTELQNKDLEMANLKSDVDTLKSDLEAYENRGSNIQNLKTQNAKLIEKCENLQIKCNNFEAEMLKIEQFKQEIAHLQRDNAENRANSIKIPDLDAQINAFKSENDALKHEIIDLNAIKLDSNALINQINTFKLEINALDALNVDLTAKNDALKAEFAEKLLEFATQNDEIREISNNYKEIEKANHNLRATLDDQCQKLEEIVANDTRDEFDALQLKFDICNTELNEQHKLREFDAKIHEETKLRLQRISEELEAKKMHSQQISEELEAKKMHSQQISDELKENKMHLQQISDELKENKMHSQQISDELKENKMHLQQISDELKENKMHSQQISDELKENKMHSQQICDELAENKMHSQLVSDKLKMRLQQISNELEENKKHSQQISDELAENKMRSQRIRDELEENKMRSEASNNELKIKLDEAMQENVKIKEENVLNCMKLQEDTKKSLLNLETKIKEKIQGEFNAKEATLKQDFEVKLTQLTDNNDTVKESQIKLMQTQDLVKELEVKLLHVVGENARLSEAYKALETNHLGLIDENNANTLEVAQLNQEIVLFESEVSKLQNEIALLRNALLKAEDDQNGLNEAIARHLDTNNKLEMQILHLNGRTNDLNGEIEQKNQALDSHEIELQKRFDTIAELKQQNNDHFATNKDLEAIKIYLQISIDDLNKKIKALERNKHEMNEENYNLQQTINELAEANAKQLKDLDYVRNQSEQNYAKLQKTNLVALAKIDALNEVKINLETNVKQLSATKDELLQKIENESFKLANDSQKHLQDNETLLQQMQANDLSHRKEVDSLKTQLDLLKGCKLNDSQKHLQDSATLLQQIETSDLSHRNEVDSIKSELIESKLQLDLLRDYELRYKSILDENHNLKEQLPQIEELKAKILILEHVQNELVSAKKQLDASKRELIEVKTESNVVCKKLLRCEQDVLEKVAEIKKLKQEIIELKILKDDLNDTQNENLKLINEIGDLRTQFNNLCEEKQRLLQKLELLQDFEIKCNTLSANDSNNNEKLKQLMDGICELKQRNANYIADNSRLREENEAIITNFEALKIKHEQFDATKSALENRVSHVTQENFELTQRLAQIDAELSGVRIQNDSLQALQNNAHTLNENGTNQLQSKIDELLEINTKFEAVYNESKGTKGELQAVLVEFDALKREKTQITLQLSELERHYNEISHEKQLLLDEIQELKIAPLNLHVNDEADALRDKIKQYKVLDATNRNCIEFYENEIEKLRAKNEKLNRRLDETLVTLNHCADLSANGMEIEYLKNVLYNYMLGKESLVMARVLTAVCKFDKEQTDAVLKNELHKQSLLGQFGIL